MSASSPQGESLFSAAAGASSLEGEGELYTPSEHTRGPWDPGALHGGAPAALLTAAFERLQTGAAPSPEGELRIARLGFEFLRPVPLVPLKLSLRVVRPGRRVQELAGELSVRAPADDGSKGPGEELVVCRASALRVRAIPADVPTTQTAANPGGDGADAAMGTPEDATPLGFALDGSTRASFASSAMEMRALGQGGWDPRQLGSGQVWMRLRQALLDGEEPTPLTRLAATADFGNGISAALP
ncbi:MAG TPA: acyl-CoA thioesterase domain-containing protein, partial [Solirubrobacteraceae bacterium]|nr:acyl-CoA thioesterase domain-containing protein [Solirubrobacteraceae bacterium]